MPCLPLEVSLNHWPNQLTVAVPVTLEDLALLVFVRLAVETEAVVGDNGFCYSMVKQFKMFRVNLQGLQFLQEKSSRWFAFFSRVAEFSAQSSLSSSVVPTYLYWRTNSTCSPLITSGLSAGAFFRKSVAISLVLLTFGHKKLSSHQQSQQSCRYFHSL